MISYDDSGAELYEQQKVRRGQSVSKQTAVENILSAIDVCVSSLVLSRTHQHDVRLCCGLLVFSQSCVTVICTLQVDVSCVC